MVLIVTGAIFLIILFFVIGYLKRPKPKRRNRNRISKLDEKNQRKTAEEKKYPNNLYKKFFIHFNSLINEEDGEYAVYAQTEPSQENDPFPVAIRKVSDKKFIGYLLYAPDLYKYLELSNDCHTFPLFVETERGEKDAYIYVDRNLVKYIVLDDDDDVDEQDIGNILFNLEEYAEYDDEIELPIRGINFRNLTESHIGFFEGYIMPDKENKHDKYAIGIYGNDGTHYGFVEKRQKALYNKIEEVGGLINANLEIDTFIDEDTGETRFKGIISIKKKDLL